MGRLVSVEFRANRRGRTEFAFPQNFHTRKLGKITIFYAVKTTVRAGKV